MVNVRVLPSVSVPVSAMLKGTSSVPDRVWDKDSGGMLGVTVLEIIEGALVPCELVAVTVKV